MRKVKNTSNLIITTAIIVLLAMAVGYATFATQISLNGTAEIIGEWDVKIIGIEAKNMSDGVQSGEPSYTNTTVTFDAKLEKPGDTITYEITIQNAGTIDATLGNVLFQVDEENGSPAILYKTTELAPLLKAGEKTTFSVTIVYDKNATEVPEVKTKTITGIIEYVQEQS